MYKYRILIAAALALICLSFPHSNSGAQAAESIPYKLYDKPSISETLAFASNKEWSVPYGLVVDLAGNVYYSDTVNHRIQIVDISGKVATLAGLSVSKDLYGLPEGGYLDGPSKQAQFREPRGIALTPSGAILVADASNHAIRQITPDGMVTTLAGTGKAGFKDGPAADASFNLPSDIAVAANGDIYVADQGNHAIRRIGTDGIVTTFAGNQHPLAEPDYANGNRLEARFNEPGGLALDGKGNLYIADSGNQVIRRIGTNSQVITIAGIGPQRKGHKGNDGSRAYPSGGYQDGPATEAQFHFPTGIEAASDGSVFIADTLNHSIRRLSPHGVVTTWSGNGQVGLTNGWEHLSAFNGPTSVASDASGHLFVADGWNQAIRQITPYAVPKKTASSSDIRIILNDRILDTDIPPQLLNGKTYVPLRHIAEALGLIVDWNEHSSEILLTRSDPSGYLPVKGIMLRIGERHVYTDHQSYAERKPDHSLDIAPFIHKGYTHVPLRFVAEYFELDIVWFAEEKLILLRSVES